MDNLSGQVAVVTGAASGIGRALAEALAKRGASLALCDVDGPGLTETMKIVERHQVPLMTSHVDVSDRGAVEAFAKQVEDRFGAANFVFNNAGVALAANVEDQSYEDFEWLMNINFWGVVHGTNSFLPLLKKANHGHLVNVSSVFGLFSVPGQSAYNAAKFAVRGFTEALQQELEAAGSSVGVSVVCPGGIKTNIAKNARVRRTDFAGDTVEDFTARFEELARTTPADAAEVILKGVAQKKRRILIGGDARMMQWIVRLFPTGYPAVLRRMWTGNAAPSKAQS